MLARVCMTGRRPLLLHQSKASETGRHAATLGAMGGAQSAEFVPEVDRPGAAPLLPTTSAAPPPTTSSSPPRQQRSPTELRGRSPDPVPVLTDKKQLQQQNALLLTRLRNCAHHVSEYDAKYHRDVHELQAQLEESQDAAREERELQMTVAGAVGLAMLLAGAGGALLARRSIMAERAVVKELQVTLGELKESAQREIVTPPPQPTSRLARCCPDADGRWGSGHRAPSRRGRRQQRQAVQHSEPRHGPTRRGRQPRPSPGQCRGEKGGGGTAEPGDRDATGGRGEAAECTLRGVRSGAF